MKTKLTMLAVVAAIALIQPTTASAINREWSAALGFLGGVLVANACSPGPGYARPAPVQCAPAPVVYYQAPPPPQPRGHYEYREERTWVPGCWVVVANYGCRQRVWQEGYYSTRMVKVWVPAPACGPSYAHHRRGRHGRR